MLRKEVAARNNLWISGRDSEPFLKNEKLRPSTACCMFIFILQVEERKGDYILNADNQELSCLKKRLCCRI